MPDFQQQQQQQNNTQSNRENWKRFLNLKFVVFCPLICIYWQNMPHSYLWTLRENKIIKRHIRDFNQLFFHVYYYVENVVDLSRLDTDNFPQRMNDYFRLYEKMHNNIEYIKAGWNCGKSSQDIWQYWALEDYSLVELNRNIWMMTISILTRR